MTMSTREAFERGTDTFNAHDIDGFAEVLADDVVEEGTFTEIHDGVLHSPMGEFQPTGRSVNLDYIQVLRFREGKHVSFNLMFDRLQMVEQFGLIPAPAA